MSDYVVTGAPRAHGRAKPKTPHANSCGILNHLVNYSTWEVNATAVEFIASIEQPESNGEAA